MKKLRLLKALRVLVASLAIGTSLFSVVSCSDISDTAEEQIDTQGKVLLRVSVNDLARTVIPSNPTSAENFVNFKLYGVKTDSYENSWSAYPEEDKILMKTFDTYEALTNGTFELEGAYARNCWRFYLTATNSANGAEFSGMSSDCLTLYLTGVNTIDFTLRLTELGTGNGNFEYNFNYESSSNASDVTSATASLYALNENGTYATTATKSWALNSTDLEGSKFQISSGTQGIEANTYRLVINLYCENVLIGQWFEVVQIATGLTSKGSESINSLTTVYKVKYHLNQNTGYSVSLGGENISEGTVTKLTAKGTANLLVPEYEGHVFLGWFTDENCETRLTWDSSTGLSEDIEIWAKWLSGSLTSLSVENAAAAIRGLTPSTTTLENPAEIKVSGTATDDFIIDIARAMQDNWNAYVSLDLSGVTDLTALPDYAFQKCNNLVSITLPNGLTTINAYVFLDTGIETITIPASVTEINCSAFYHNDKLTEIKVAEGNEIYQNDASGVLYRSEPKTLVRYPDNKTDKNYTIPAGTVAIGDCAFDNATLLESVSIPTSVTSLGRYAFNGCTSLEQITLPSGLKSPIAEYAFSGTSSLKSINIPNGVTSIDYYAFGGSGIETIEIPASVTSINYDAFLGAENLESITVASENTAYKSIDGILYSKDGTELIAYPRNKADESFTIPNSVKKIAYNAFYQPKNLKELSFGSGIDFIEQSAFVFCQFISFTPAQDNYVWYKYISDIPDTTTDEKEYVISYGKPVFSLSNDVYSVDAEIYFNTNASAYYAKSNKTMAELIASFETVTVQTGESLDVSDNSYTIVDGSQSKWFKITTTANTKYKANWCDSYSVDYVTFTNKPEGLADYYIYVYDSDMNELTNTDDAPVINFTATGATTYIEIRTRGGNGKCAFRIEEIKDTE